MARQGSHGSPLYVFMPPVSQTIRDIIAAWLDHWQGHDVVSKLTFNLLKGTRRIFGFIYLRRGWWESHYHGSSFPVVSHHQMKSVEIEIDAPGLISAVDRCRQFSFFVNNHEHGP